MLKRVKMMLIKLGLVLVITISIFLGGKVGNVGKVAYATSNGKGVYSTVQYQKQMSDLKDVKDVLKGIQNSNVQSESNVIKPNSRGKILLYNSHSCEKNQDSTIQQVTSNLKLKLEKKGFQVEQNLTPFANVQGYNRSYYSSGAWLDTQDLSKYVLCIDCHMDATPNSVEADFKNGGVARLMFPNVSQNPNLKAETNIVDRIKNGLNTFSDKIYRENVTHYKKGIIYYCLDKSPNMILMEIGSDKNNFESCARANTLVSSAIERAFK